MPNFQTLEFDLSAAETTTVWKRLTWTTPQTARIIQGALVSGDTVRVDFTLDKLVAEQNIMETSATTNVFSSTSAYATEQFQDTYLGAPRWVRVVKTGTTGTARIIIEG